MTGSSTMLRAPEPFKRIRHRRDGGGAREHADLHRRDLEVGETASIWAVMKSGGASWMAVTPSVFCAVRAVMTLAP